MYALLMRDVLKSKKGEMSPVTKNRKINRDRSLRRDPLFSGAVDPFDTFAGAPLPRDRDAGPKHGQFCWGRRGDEERPEVHGCGGTACVSRAHHLRKVRGKASVARSPSRDCCAPGTRFSSIESLGVGTCPSIWWYVCSGRAAEHPSLVVTAVWDTIHNVSMTDVFLSN